MSFSRLQSIFKSPFYHLPDNATVQVLISSNSFIFLCFLNTFQGTQESQRELREAKSTEFPLQLLHIFNKSFHYKWHEWVEATLRKKKKKAKLPKLPAKHVMDNPLKMLCPMDLRLWDAGVRVGIFSFLFQAQLPVLLIACQSCFVCSGPVVKPMGVMLYDMKPAIAKWGLGNN